MACERHSTLAAYSKIDGGESPKPRFRPIQDASMEWADQGSSETAVNQLRMAAFSWA